jgi:hypothetical protein
MERVVLPVSESQGASVFLQHRHTKVLRAGLDPADQNRWLCSWSSDGQEPEIDVAATAYCLQEVLPADEPVCTPVAESIVYKQHTETLQPGPNRLQVQCDPGQHLLLGNCMLDGEDVTRLEGMTMFRFGFPPGDQSTWGCSWNNPTDARPLGIATAICIAEGPSAASQAAWAPVTIQAPLR